MYGIEERKKRWMDALSENDGAGHLFMINFDDEPLALPHPWPDQKAERIEWALKVYEARMERTTWLRDDSIPYVYAFTGTEIFAEALGCDVYRPDNDMPCAIPFIMSPADAAKVRVPRLEDSSLAMLFDIADELRQRAGDDALLRIVDIQSPIDIAAIMWDKADFYTSMVLCPEAFLELAAKVKELLTAFLDAWFARYGREFVAHYPDYYMPYGVTLSADEIGAVSAEQFNAYFLPELVDLSERYGQIGIHSCANSRHQWEGFREVPNLRLLNLNQPLEIVREAYGYFAEEVVHMHSWCGDGEPWTWVDTYPEGARVVLQVAADSRDQARMLSDRLWQTCRRQ